MITSAESRCGQNETESRFEQRAVTLREPATFGSSALLQRHPLFAFSDSQPGSERGSRLITNHAILGCAEVAGTSAGVHGNRKRHEFTTVVVLTASGQTKLVTRFAAGNIADAACA